MSFSSAVLIIKPFLIKICRFLGYFLLLFGLCYQIQRLYKKLKIEPEIFSKESSIQSSEIPFPAVTFCPPNTIKNEAWNPEYLKQINLTLNDLRGASLQTCPNHDIFMEYKDNDNINIVDTLFKCSPDFVDVVNHCGLNNYWMNLQNCDKLFIRSVTEYGTCYTFNLLRHDLIFNKIISTDFDTFKRTKIAKSWEVDQIMNETRQEEDKDPPTWSTETGYLSDEDNIQPARALKMQTLVFGSINRPNDSFCEKHGKNYKMMLHLPNELPQISHETINIPIGKEVRIMISAEMIIFEESLRSFTPLKRGCFFEGEKPLKIFKSYTKANCEYECMTDFVNSSYGCVKFSMPRTKDMKVCSYNYHDRIKAITDVFPRSYYEDHKNKKIFPHYPCGCLPSCTEIKYKVIKYENDDKNNELVSSNQMHAVPNVIFVDSQIHLTANYVTYEMENFIFDIGGLIGLFLGSSILSVLETVVSMCLTIKNRCKKMINWFQQRIGQESEVSSSSIEPQQPERFETVLDIPLDEIESIESAEEQQAEQSIDI